eukprot:8059133-Lingulodinium_polyedra.AAC.1
MRLFLRGLWAGAGIAQSHLVVVAVAPSTLPACPICPHRTRAVWAASVAVQTTGGGSPDYRRPFHGDETRRSR